MNVLINCIWEGVANDNSCIWAGVAYDINLNGALDNRFHQKFRFCEMTFPVIAYGDSELRL